MSLERPDQLLLDAASGWLGLGNWQEAQKELEGITPGARDQPEVLSVRWEVYARGEKWELAAEVGKTLTERLPDLPFGWVHQAYALHEMKRTQEAWDVLLPVVDRFPLAWLVRYNLACYACQMGNPQQALEWLAKATALAGRENIRAMALEDPDLEPLRNQLKDI